ncbi:MAG: type II toxin-antitoxin system HicA family toxin [Candidatus Marinimicrobia bacterium]|nr:type II toxin-antitoxin system HicA family toxin [Candidatus Neomarinimicrobiota bacterium]
MAKRTSKKPRLRWREIKTIIERNGVEVSEGAGSRKKLRKQTSQGSLKSTIHAHGPGSEIPTAFIDQIIDKFGKDEAEFYG